MSSLPSHEEVLAARLSEQDRTAALENINKARDFLKSAGEFAGTLGLEMAAGVIPGGPLGVALAKKALDHVLKNS